MELNAGRGASKHTPFRSRAQKADDDADIARLYLAGKSQRDIVKWIAANRAYTLSLGMINWAIKKAVAAWQASAASDIAAFKARDLAKLNEVESRATEAYERSCTEAVKTVQERALDKNGKAAGKGKVNVTRYGRDGDPRFLAIIIECVVKRAQIFGYLTERHEIGNIPGQPLQVQLAPEKVSKERLQQILAEIELVKRTASTGGGEAHVEAVVATETKGKS